MSTAKTMDPPLPTPMEHIFRLVNFKTPLRPSPSVPKPVSLTVSKSSHFIDQNSSQLKWAVTLDNRYGDKKLKTSFYSLYMP